MANDPDSNRPDQPRLGVDDRYRIRRELGRGMMGAVWEADDTVLGRTVAIKTIELAFGVAVEGRDPFERRFFTEARAAAKLSHPGIVVCHDVGKDPASGKLFIVFEHLKGRTLAERMAAGPVPWREALPIVVSVARAVHHAHDHGVLHRDLKPANVMLLEAGAAETEAGAAVKIMDFGVAHVESAEPGLTAEGDRFGSPAYMSPEMTLGLPSDARSDIFSIGSILCTMLLGREWFAAPSIPTTLERVVHQDAPVLSALVPGVPPTLDTVVARAMAKRPEDRHASAAELADDLDDVLAGRVPRHTGPPEAAHQGPAEPVDTETPLSELVALVGRGPARPGSDVPDPLAALVEQPPEPPAPQTTRRAGSPLVRRLGAVAALALLLVPITVYLLRRHSPPTPAAAALALPARATPVPLPTDAPPAVPLPTAAPPAGSPVSASPTTAPAPPVRPATTGPPRRSSDARKATAAAPGPAVSERPQEAGTLPTPARAEARRDTTESEVAGQARVRLEVEHPLDSGHLTVWVDGGLAFETKLQAESAKKIVALTFRSGHLEKMLEVSPGRHEVRVEVRWDAERRVASTIADVASGSTGLLEVRLGRMTRELRLSWSRLAGD